MEMRFEYDTPSETAWGIEVGDGYEPHDRFYMMIGSCSDMQNAIELWQKSIVADNAVDAFENDNFYQISDVTYIANGDSSVPHLYANVTVGKKTWELYAFEIVRRVDFRKLTTSHADDINNYFDKFKDATSDWTKAALWY